MKKMNLVLNKLGVLLFIFVRSFGDIWVLEFVILEVKSYEREGEYT